MKTSEINVSLDYTPGKGYVVLTLRGSLSSLSVNLNAPLIKILRNALATALLEVQNETP